MTIWSPLDIAKIWIAAGGAYGATGTDQVINFTCIGLAESGGDDHAISPDGALGVWQIMPFHFGQGGIGPDNWMNPVVNARAAIVISGNGNNCAPWATAYVNSNNPPYVSFLHDPEPGSPAYDRIPVVVPILNGAGLTGGKGRAPVLNGTPAPASVEAAWDGVRSYVQHQAPAQWQNIYSAARGIQALAAYRGG